MRETRIIPLNLPYSSSTGANIHNIPHFCVRFSQSARPTEENSSIKILCQSFFHFSFYLWAFLPLQTSYIHFFSYKRTPHPVFCSLFTPALPFLHPLPSCSHPAWRCSSFSYFSFLSLFSFRHLGLEETFFLFTFFLNIYSLYLGRRKREKKKIYKRRKDERRNSAFPGIFVGTYFIPQIPQKYHLKTFYA